MVIPDKHLHPRRSLLGIGAILATTHLDKPKTVTSLWLSAKEIPEINSFEQFAFALDLLFAIGVIEFRNGLIRKTKS
jgi:hypothetical protein